MFMYISPFDTAAPALVPKSVVKINMNTIPPNIAYTEHKTRVFFIILTKFFVGNAISDGRTKKITLKISVVKIESFGKKATVEYSAATVDASERRRRAGFLFSIFEQVYIITESIRKFIKKSKSM